VAQDVGAFAGQGQPRTREGQSDSGLHRPGAEWLAYRQLVPDEDVTIGGVRPAVA
jgi:hypothetical protein